jgi:hypothetical protein
MMIEVVIVKGKEQSKPQKKLKIEVPVDAWLVSFNG